MKKIFKICILGDGGWGTTLAILLHNKSFNVTQWGAFPEYIKFLNKKRENTKFLPGIKIPTGIKLLSDIKEALLGADMVVIAIPSQYVRNILRKNKTIIKKSLFKDAIFVSVAKGIETKTLRRVSEIIFEELGSVNLGVLSGPTIAVEVARKIPTSCVTASNRTAISQTIQTTFCTEFFRIYTTKDVIGVELGGALKNIIAIAAGISDGLGFGTNSKSALLSRGLVEILRLGIKMGAKKETFYGLSGIGDLVTTCISPFGRNRWFGEQIGKGYSALDVLRRTQMVIEGVTTVKSAYQLAKRYKVDMPITEQIYRVLYRGKRPLQAVKDLMLRPMKPELII